jgi:hypothetical protein
MKVEKKNIPSMYYFCSYNLHEIKQFRNLELLKIRRNHMDYIGIHQEFYKKLLPSAPLTKFLPD